MDLPCTARNLKLRDPYTHTHHVEAERPIHTHTMLRIILALMHRSLVS